LRFPGFEEEWETKRLGDITTWSSGGTPPKDNPLFWNGDIPWISASSMRGLLYSDSELKLTQAGLKKGSKLATKGTLLLLVRGSMLFNKIPIGVVSKDVAFNQDVKSIVVSDCSTSAYILSWFTASEPKILNMVTGTGIGAGKLDLQELKGLRIKIPPLHEQQKITAFLSLINERIDTHSKIIEQLKTLIQEVGDKIFEQKIKLKRYNDVWAVKSLGSIGKTFNGLTGKNKENFGKGKPYIQYKQIFDSSKVQIEHCGLIEITENENQSLVMYGDIFFTISSETPGEIGMSSVLLDEVNEMYLNSFCFGYRPKSLQIINPLFARFFFRSSVFRNEVVKLAQGSTRYNMSKVELMKLNVSLPSLEEQIIISNFLSSINKRIEVENNILERYKSQKQYLLQNLFI
jgi:type I restriction enzyme, S subunit